MHKADNLPPSFAVVTKSGSLNFLEPSGPVQACNGTAVPFYLCIIIQWDDRPIYGLPLTEMPLCSTYLCYIEPVILQGCLQEVTKYHIHDSSIHFTAQIMGLNGSMHTVHSRIQSTPFLQFQRAKKSDTDYNRVQIRFAVMSWVLEKS